MEKIFDVSPTEVVPVANTVIMVPKRVSRADNYDQDLRDAYAQSKENLQDIIIQNQDAAETLLTIAKLSEKARDFEVFAQLMKNSLESNKELIELQKQVRTLEEPKTVNTNIDKAIFVGSTRELAALISGKGPITSE